MDGAVNLKMLCGDITSSCGSSVESRVHIVLLMVECDKIIKDKVTQDNYRIKSLFNMNPHDVEPTHYML